MALINCPECEKEISYTVKACPHCGFRIKKRSKIFEHIPKKKAATISFFIVAIALAIIIIVFVTNSGNKIPEYVSPETYADGVQAVEVVNDFLNGFADADATMDKLGTLNDKISERYESYETREYWKDFHISLNISIIRQKISYIDMSFLSEPTTIEDVKAALEALKKDLNVK